MWSKLHYVEIRMNFRPAEYIVKLLFDISAHLHLQSHATTAQLLCIYTTFSESTKTLTRKLSVLKPVFCLLKDAYKHNNF